MLVDCSVTRLATRNSDMTSFVAHHYGMPGTSFQRRAAAAEPWMAWSNITTPHLQSGFRATRGTDPAAAAGHKVGTGPPEMRSHCQKSNLHITRLIFQFPDSLAQLISAVLTPSKELT